jgi:magnesium chelatase subunit D
MSSPLAHQLQFTEVVGQEDAKLALLLAACDPLLGGVLLRGEKGSAKTTLARGLAALLRDDAPFVELPLGATEDRVIGSIDTAALLTTGTTRVRAGLLAAAHGGVLYVDEINLLPPHLVDSLLDAAASGTHRIERDGVSHEHPARFVLIGSMNPEEGDLRPQLLDRFGLVVDVAAPQDQASRAQAVRRQLDRERAHTTSSHAVDPTSSADHDDLRSRLDQSRPAVVTNALIHQACALALSVAVEGLRADLMLCRAAAALAGFEGRSEADLDDLYRVAPFVLAHRARRDPPPRPHSTRPSERGTEPRDDGTARDDGDAADSGTDNDTGPSDPGPPSAPDADPQSATSPAISIGRRLGADQPASFDGRRSRGAGTDGRLVRDRSYGDGLAVAPLPTARALAERRSGDPTAVLAVGDLRAGVHTKAAGTLVVLAVDTSGSMGVHRRLDEARRAALGLLTDAYQHRDRVALVTFGGDRATVALRPTASVELARARVSAIDTGGATPLADALRLVNELLRGRSDAEPGDAIVVLLTDGRATTASTTGRDPVADSLVEAAALRRCRATVVVVDAEQGVTRLGLCGPLAAALDAESIGLDDVLDGGLEQLVRQRLATRRVARTART